ncbi:unnamed protein product [Peronospora farinosa]|uniref:Uncharacterized protein n=1 Tax=Peronospora farinosa TaxID=134698 RepID=A0AAV0UGY2_9STRA|nr:unnamed protein product [Peronospora farinosa]
MTVSSRTGNSVGLASLPASIASLGATDASLLRSFAVLLCSKCRYLEFPGCDVHGSLYTQQLTDMDGKLYAKCPMCSAGTNTARPFRDGCRRCKAPTTVTMWICSLQEIQQTVKAFPVMTEAIEHTVLICEHCFSAIFPRSRERLTLRTALEPLTTASGKYLKVSNFQLSMPHVEGCLRRGMPLQPIAVQLPKSELKFLVERIEKCPLAMKVIGKPQYRSRNVEIVTKQNHLHQVAIRLLSTVIGAFDPDSTAAVEPLRQVVAILEKLEPLVLFSEWSPPRQLSHEKVLPNEVVSSSVFNIDHAASKVLENNSSFWRSASKTDDNVPQSNEWIVCQFSTPVTLSSIELKWHPDYLPEQFSLGISRYNMSYDTVAVVVVSTTESRILVPKGSLVTSIKLTMISVDASGKSFGLVSIICHEASFSSVHTSTGLVLRNIQRWLHDAAVSSLPEVRDLALHALQRLSVASGSLCGLLQLATCLMLNSRERVGSTIATADMNRKRWNQLDLLSENGQSSAQQFVQELAASIQRIVVGAHSRVDLQDKHVIEQLFLLQEEGMHVAESKSSNENVACSIGLFTLLIGRQDVLESIKRRSQLGLIILHMISELSAWQMKRMQKAEEYTGKHKLELMQLEEPFSMEICPELFAISHRLLISVLSGPHQQRQNKTDSCTQNGDEEDDDAAVSGNDGGNDSVGESFQDLYNDLALSFGHYRADVEKQEERSDSLPGHSHGGYTDHSKFSPEGLCVAVLEIVTSNLRRLVLSKIDPIEIGITPAQAHNENDLLSAPPALNPTVSLLEQLISLGTKRTDAFFPVSLKAAAAMEVGTEAFHPSVHQRTKVLASRMGKGATLEVQVRWPVQERDQEDPRYERLILMLQLECIKLGIRQAVRGTWYFFMHLVVEVPSAHATEEVLTQHFAPCIQRAGFSSWQVTAGAQELSIKLQRHLHWNRVEKMLQDSGAGWIRVYPADVASYDEVLADVEGFLAEHGTYG